jgi:hypothetical protein
LKGAKRLNKVYKALTFSLVVGGLLTTILLASTSAAKTSEEEAHEVVTQYLDAVKSRNVDEMIKHVKDTRFPVEELRKRYLEIHQENPVHTVELVELSKVSETHLLAKIRFTSNISGDQVIELPVVKENGEWKVVIGQVDVHHPEVVH